MVNDSCWTIIWLNCTKQQSFFLGPSGSGKSSLLKQILLNRDQHFSKPFHKVKYYYAEARPEGIPSVEYHRGMPSEITNNPNSGHALYIFDDLMSEANNDDLRNAFIRTSHHQNITIVLIIQNLFFKSPVARDISLNTKYMVRLLTIKSSPPHHFITLYFDSRLFSKIPEIANKFHF